MHLYLGLECAELRTMAKNKTYNPTSLYTNSNLEYVLSKIDEESIKNKKTWLSIASIKKNQIWHVQVEWQAATT